MASWRFYPAGGMKDCYFVPRTSMPNQRPPMPLGRSRRRLRVGLVGPLGSLALQPGAPRWHQCAIMCIRAAMPMDARASKAWARNDVTRVSRWCSRCFESKLCRAPFAPPYYPDPGFSSCVSDIDVAPFRAMFRLSSRFGPLLVGNKTSGFASAAACAGAGHASKGVR